MAATHTDKSFERDLKDLRDKLLAIGAKVESQIAESVAALHERDAARAQKVMHADVEINRLEMEIDEACRRILALRQPAASDLRLITTALKIVVDIERIGDLAVSIASRVVDLSSAPPLTTQFDLPKLASLAQGQVKGSLDAFVHADVAKAQQVIQGDELLDVLFSKLFNDLLTLMMEDSKNIRRATSLMSVAKHLERIGDHAKNVAEMVIYMVQGTDVRHRRSREIPKAS